jgi:Trm5-related predicted tRNA methylase
MYGEELVDLVIIGDSNTNHLDDTKMYKYKTATVIATGAKTFPGVQKELFKIPQTKAIVLHYGINDLMKTENPHRVIAQAEQTIQKIQEKCPDTHLIISSVLPCYSNSVDNTKLLMRDIEVLNAMLRQTCMNGGPNLHFLDHAAREFMSDKLYSDNVHLNSLGISYLVRDIKGKVFSVCT